MEKKFIKNTVKAKGLISSIPWLSAIELAIPQMLSHLKSANKNKATMFVNTKAYKYNKKTATAKRKKYKQKRSRFLKNVNVEREVTPQSMHISFQTWQQDTSCIFAKIYSLPWSARSIWLSALSKQPSEQHSLCRWFVLSPCTELENSQYFLLQA